MWISYALASALLLAIRRVYEKQLSAQFGNFSLSLLTLAFSLPFVGALFFFFPAPTDPFALPWSFWWPLIIIWIVLYPFQNYFLYRSLREGELSEVTPIGALLPVLNIGTSFFLIHEFPSTAGIAGIVATVLGTYLLLTDLPARGSARETWHGRLNLPVLFMLLSVLCTALGSTLDKVAIESSTPVFYTFANLLGAVVVFSVLTFALGQQKDFRHLRATYPLFLALGIVFALAFVAFATAFTLGPTSYTLAIRSGGFMLAALWGILFLHESLSRRKLLALALFTAGTLALALG